MNQFQDADRGAPMLAASGTQSNENARRAPALPPKGTCWYCDRPVDNVRRFCSIACRDDYFDEEWTNGPPAE